ncbi:MAG TPA: hypothetical protein VH280_19055 [Verrucomicrobiae bacterium]|jgi:hypothetical protein|nr:hypothetical protein [Verrucomicrobiae bacterium]
MKTPREILLARHRAIETKLDDIRQDVIKKLNNKDAKTRSFSDSLASFFLGGPKAIWHKLIWPSRRIWATLATVWILILAANFSLRDHSEIKMAKSPPSQEVIVSFRQQQALLSELIGPDDRLVAEPQKKYSPRPASERQKEILIT